MTKRCAAILILIGTGLLLFISGAFIFGACFCTATLHVRRKLGPKPANASVVSVAAPDGALLSGWWLNPGSSNGNCVIVLHGVADSRTGAAGFAPLFLDAGYAVLLPDSRAHGASGGRFVTYGLKERFDVLVWADWLLRQHCRKLYGLGESLGGAVLIQSAAIRPVFSAIVAECAYASLQDVAEYRITERLKIVSPFSRVLAALIVGTGMIYARFAYHLDFAAVQPVRDIRAASTPILLIHGLQDTETPPSHSKRLWAANRGNSLWLVPEAGHTGAASARPEEFRQRILAWFAAH